MFAIVKYLRYYDQCMTSAIKGLRLDCHYDTYICSGCFMISDLFNSCHFFCYLLCRAYKLMHLQPMASQSVPEEVGGIRWRTFDKLFSNEA